MNKTETITKVYDDIFSLLKSGNQRLLLLCGFTLFGLFVLWLVRRIRSYCFDDDLVRAYKSGKKAVERELRARFRVDEIKVTKRLTTGTRPYLFTKPDQAGGASTCLLKYGDNLEIDIQCLRTLMWISRACNIVIPVYNVIPLGANIGVIECVEHATTLDKTPLDKIDPRTLPALIVSAYVLGLGDRHNANIMVVHHTLFHIDFGWVLGQRPAIERYWLPIFFAPPAYPMCTTLRDYYEQATDRNLLEACEHTFRELQAQMGNMPAPQDIPHIHAFVMAKLNEPSFPVDETSGPFTTLRHFWHYWRRVSFYPTLHTILVCYCLLFIPPFYPVVIVVAMVGQTLQLFLDQDKCSFDKDILVIQGLRCAIMVLIDKRVFGEGVYEIVFYSWLIQFLERNGWYAILQILHALRTKKMIKNREYKGVRTMYNPKVLNLTFFSKTAFLTCLLVAACEMSSPHNGTDGAKTAAELKTAGQYLSTLSAAQRTAPNSTLLPARCPSVPNDVELKFDFHILGVVESLVKNIVDARQIALDLGELQLAENAGRLKGHAMGFDNSLHTAVKQLSQAFHYAFLSLQHGGDFEKSVAYRKVVATFLHDERDVPGCNGLTNLPQCIANGAKKMRDRLTKLATEADLLSVAVYRHAKELEEKDSSLLAQRVEIETEISFISDQQRELEKQMLAERQLYELQVREEADATSQWEAARTEFEEQAWVFTAVECARCNTKLMRANSALLHAKTTLEQAQAARSTWSDYWHDAANKQAEAERAVLVASEGVEQVRLACPEEGESQRCQPYTEADVKALEEAVEAVKLATETVKTSRRVLTETAARISELNEELLNLTQPPPERVRRLANLLEYCRVLNGIGYELKESVKELEKLAGELPRVAGILQDALPEPGECHSWDKIRASVLFQTSALASGLRHGEV